MQAWVGFYTVIGGAAATLMGLLFVAVSLNAAVMLAETHQHARRQAEQAFKNYLTVLLVSLVALFPIADIANFGIWVLGLTIASAFWAVARLVMAATHRDEDGSWVKALRRQLTALVGYGMLLFAATGMAFHLVLDRTLLAGGMMILLFSATVTAWLLLVNVANPRASG
jgi:hypothetical protein